MSDDSVIVVAEASSVDDEVVSSDSDEVDVEVASDASVDVVESYSAVEVVEEMSSEAVVLSKPERERLASGMDNEVLSGAGAKETGADIETGGEPLIFAA